MDKQIMATFCVLPTIVGFAPRLFAESPSELFNRARIENRRAVESAHSLYCGFSYSVSRPDESPTMHQAGEYWRSGNTFRIKWKSAEQSADVLVREGRMLSILSSLDSRGSRNISAGIAQYAGFVGLCDPTYDSLFAFRNPREPTKARLTFDELMTEQKARFLSAESNQDSVLIRVQTGEDHNVTEYRFATGMNYLISEVRALGPNGAGGDNLPTSRVVRFVEPTPGIFFPAQVIKELTSNGKSYSQNWEFRNVTVNGPLPTGIMELRFPKGVTAHDLIQKKSYVVDESGNPAGPLSDLKTVPPPPKGMKFLTETREEPKSWTRWILPASLLCLVLSLSTYVIRQWRARRATG